MTLVNFSRTTSLFQPVFVIGITAIVFLGGVVKVLFGGATSVVIIEAVFGLVLMAVSSLPVFLYWKYVRQNKILLVLGSYFIWLLIVPLVWLLSIKGLLHAYGFLVVWCCAENEFLAITVWDKLYRLTSSTLVPVLFSTSLVYISIWLQKTVSSTKLRIFVNGMIGVSMILILFSCAILFSGMD